MMRRNLQKTILNGSEYELVPAEVVSVDFEGNDRERLYTVGCIILGAYGSRANDIVTARPIDVNIKNIPIIGECVMLMKGPTSYNAALSTGAEYYYTNPIPIHSSVHHNGIPGISKFVAKADVSQTQKDETEATDGVPRKSNEMDEPDLTLDKYFVERKDVYPIQPYSGDLIFEGRWGQSIRMGSTIDLRRKYPVRPKWGDDCDPDGNPITIISNGTNPKDKTYNEYIIENPDTDDSSIWLTSGQKVQFNPASEYTPSIQSKKVDIFKQKEYSGNRILLASDSIILNAKQDEVIAYSKSGIGLSTENKISIDGKQVVETESSRINLGINALSPALLGDRTMDWLRDLCSAFSETLLQITNIIHPTGTGPSGLPLNSGAFNSIRSKVQNLKGQIDTLQSRLVFLNENSGGPDERSMNNEANKIVKDKQKENNETNKEQEDPTDALLSGKDFRTHNSYPWLYNPITQELYTYRESIEKDNPTLLIAWQTEMSRYNRNGIFDSRIFDQYFSEEIRLRKMRENPILPLDLYPQPGDEQYLLEAYRCENIQQILGDWRFCNNCSEDERITLRGRLESIFNNRCLDTRQSSTTPVQGSINIENILFDTNSDVIKPESFIVIDKLTAQLKQFPTMEIEIGGHTDSRGGAAQNQALSQRRSDSVKRALVERGIDGNRLVPVGYGEYKPLYTNSTEEGRSKNRRTEIKILKQ